MSAAPRTLSCPTGCGFRASNNTGLAAHLRQTHNQHGKGALARALNHANRANLSGPLRLDKPANPAQVSLAKNAQESNEVQVLGNNPAKALQALIAHAEAQLDAMQAELEKLAAVQASADKLRQDIGTLTTAYKTITATSGE